MYIYGKNVVKTALSTNQKRDVEKLYLYQNFDDRNLLSIIEKSKIPIEFLTKIEMEHIVRGNHQGIIAKVKEFEYSRFEEFNQDNAFLVILDHIEDPHNFGAIVRTCEAAGVTGIIIPKDRACEVNSTVIKVSTGAINNMKIAQVTNLNVAIKKLKEQGFWIIGTDMQGENYRKLDYSGKIGIVIGNEGKGMSRLTSELCDFKASIPMVGKTNSLNASVATGIVIFEALGRRSK